MNTNPQSKDFRLGILGGGQLGRMLQQEAVNLDIKLAVLDPSPDAPCSKMVQEFVCGDFNDYDTVYNFGKNKDVLTVEIEHVNVDALEKLEGEGVKVYPQPGVLRIIQDKGLQKDFYKEWEIPTADYLLVKSASEIREQFDFLPAMQKLRKGGYDGRGVQKISGPNDLDKAFDAPSVLETLVSFEKELAVIVARNENGDVKTFPVVELEFNPKANLVEFLFCPAAISQQQADTAAKIATRVIEAFNMVGILAVEMFLTKEGEILVNEVAPRPHNSGHQTIEANITSQYGQHLRAILNLPLGETDVVRPAAMVNLLGEDGFTGPVTYENLPEALKISGVYPHIYGKSETKPFRKMGHVTITGTNINEVREKAMEVKELIKVKSKQ